MQTFWDRVRVLMRATTVVELASLLGVKRSTLSSWIHADRRPPLDILLKISESTGMSVEQLEYGYDYERLDEDEVSDNLPAYRKEVKSWIDDLDGEELRILRMLAQYLRNRTIGKKS